jgi:hypothetical protein
MPSGVNCDCGSELDLDDAYCRSCGKKKNFKVDPRLTDEAWIEWRKYQAENALSDTADSNLVENSRFPNGSVIGKDKPSKDSLREVKQEFRDRNAPKKDVFKAAQTRRQVRKVIRNSTILVLIALLIFFVSRNSERILDSDLIKPIIQEVETFENPFSDSTNLSEGAVDVPSIDLGSGTITAGKPLDLYVTWPIECAIPPGESYEEKLVCSDYLVIWTEWKGIWWDDPKIRKEVCSMTNNFSNSYDLWPSQLHSEKVIPPDTELFVYDAYSLNPITKAALIGVPEFKTATLSNVDRVSIDPNTYDPMTSEEAAARQFGAGFCVIHFQVGVMPEFSGSLTVSTTVDQDDERGATWFIDSSNDSSRQFLFPGGEWMNEWEKIWDMNNLGTNPDVYLP